MSRRSKRARKKTRTQRKEGAEASPDITEGDDSGGFLKIGVGFVLGVLLLWGAVYLGQDPDSVKDTESPSTATVVQEWKSQDGAEVAVTSRDFALGPADAKVTIVEFSDFECPYCRRAAANLKKLQKTFESDVRLVFKNYPLDTSCNDKMKRQMHPQACRAAAMARCAGYQRAELFWEMHDAIFGTERLSEDSLAALVPPLQLDESLFSECLADEATMNAIRDDIAQGQELGVSATPTLLINGKRMMKYDPPTLEALVEDILGDS